MHGLTVNNIHLDQVLAPIAVTLDQCWWYLGGAGMSFPWVRPPARLPAQPHAENNPVRRGPGRHSRPEKARFDPVDWQRYLDESRAASEEYDNWIEPLGHERIGKPGFFSRYSAGMDEDWKIYFASDAPALEQAGFADAGRRFSCVWFDAPPEDMPSDISLIVRGVDAAYLDLFFFAMSGCTALSWSTPRPKASAPRRSVTVSLSPCRPRAGRRSKASCARTRRSDVGTKAAPQSGCAPARSRMRR